MVSQMACSSTPGSSPRESISGPMGQVVPSAPEALRHTNALGADPFVKGIRTRRFKSRLETGPYISRSHYRCPGNTCSLLFFGASMVCS